MTMTRIKFLPQWRWLLSLVYRTPVFDGPLVHCRGVTYARHGWVYALPVERELYRTVVQLPAAPTYELLTRDGECIMVRLLVGFTELDEVGVVYGLLVERKEKE